LIVEDTQSDLYVAIDRAADRIGRTFDRQMTRRREFPMASVSRKQFATMETE
jgi:ribosome-associated translation inhibitor RaiA